LKVITEGYDSQNYFEENMAKASGSSEDLIPSGRKSCTIKSYWPRKISFPSLAIHSSCSWNLAMSSLWITVTVCCFTSRKF